MSCYLLRVPRRMGRDSNPRWTFAHAGFQDRCLKPLGHPSKIIATVTMTAGNSQMFISSALTIRPSRLIQKTVYTRQCDDELACPGVFRSSQRGWN